jgi:hypothetical protein
MSKSKSKVKEAQLKKVEENKQVQVEIHLSYYKKGDDLNHCLNETGNDPVEALKMHSQFLESDAKQLKDLADLIANDLEEVDITADCHFIWVNCNKRLADKIVKAGLGNFPPEDEQDM